MTQDSPLSILHWNSRSLIPKFNELKLLNEEHHFDIIVITETWLQPRHNIQFRHYLTIRNDRKDGKGGICILVNKKFDLTYIEMTTNPQSHDTQYILLKILDYALLAIYNPPPFNLLSLNWKKIIDKMTSPYLIITGDFNIPPRQHNKGQQHPFFQILSTNGLYCINENKHTRIGFINQQDSSPDLTFLSANLLNSYTWETYSDTLGSDHYPIIIKLNMKKDVFSLASRQNITHINWNLFRAFLMDNITLISNEQNYIIKYRTLISIIQEYFNLFHPIVHISIKRKKTKPVWWNSECSRLIARRKLALNTYKKQKTLSTYILLKKQMAQTKKQLKQSKREAWDKYCDSLNDISNPKQFWNKLKWFTTKHKTVEYKDNYNSDWISKFHNIIAPDSVHQEITPLPTSNTNNSTPISVVEIMDVLKTHTRKSAPGPDGVTYEMIRNLPPLYFDEISIIFNEIILYGMIPESWSETHIIPIHKQNTDPNNEMNYRPIALTNTFKKLLEKIIANRIMYQLESTSSWPHNQFGFRKGYSTLNNLAILTIDVLLALHRKESVDSLFLDISKAFDSVLLPELKQDLLVYNIPANFINFIMKVLQARTTCIKIGNHITGKRITSQGLPQGSSLSPILFAIYTGKLWPEVNDKVRLLQFADDIVLYTTSSYDQIHSHQSSLQYALNKAITWLSNKGLYLNTSKTKRLIFSRRNTTHSTQLNINGTPIETTTSIKFLGMIFDNKLTWNKHLTVLNDKLLETKKNYTILSRKMVGF